MPGAKVRMKLLYLAPNFDMPNDGGIWSDVSGGLGSNGKSK